MSPASALTADNNNKSAKRKIPFSLTVIVINVKLHMKYFIHCCYYQRSACNIIVDSRS